MMRSHTSRHAVWLIALVALIYGALLVIAEGCALTHADRSQSHHHNGEGSSDQNVLCAWACQATADAPEASGPPPTVAELLVGLADLIPTRLCLLPSSSNVQTRAPPLIPFVRLG